MGPTTHAIAPSRRPVLTAGTGASTGVLLALAVGPLTAPAHAQRLPQVASPAVARSAAAPGLARGVDLHGGAGPDIRSGPGPAPTDTLSTPTTSPTSSPTTTGTSSTPTSPTSPSSTTPATPFVLTSAAVGWADAHHQQVTVRGAAAQAGWVDIQVTGPQGSALATGRLVFDAAGQRSAQVPFPAGAIGVGLRWGTLPEDYLYYRMMDATPVATPSGRGGGGVTVDPRSPGPVQAPTRAARTPVVTSTTPVRSPARTPRTTTGTTTSAAAARPTAAATTTRTTHAPEVVRTVTTTHRATVDRASAQAPTAPGISPWLVAVTGVLPLLAAGWVLLRRRRAH